MANGICVYAESYKGKLEPVAAELVSAAKEIQKTTGEKVQAIVLAEDPDGIAAELDRLGVEEIYAVKAGRDCSQQDDAVSEAISEMLKKIGPSSVLIPATPEGRSIFSRVAMKLGCGLTADCTEVLVGTKEDGSYYIKQNKPSFGENVFVTIITRDGYYPQMMTVRPGVYVPQEEAAGGQAKIEYFEDNHSFVMNAINLWGNWTKDYRVFKTTYKEDMKHDCEDDGIEEETWSSWYHDWQQLRYAIELKMQPIIERGLRDSMPTNSELETSVPEQLIAVLEEYKNQIDKFYQEERKGIYQKFAFQVGGELQDKFETESSLYKYVAIFQSSLQDIIFNCKNAEDRVWILNWANSLLDIQIDEILEFVADNDLQKISHTILDEFASLKQKNYDIYLADVKAYSEEKARREKEYNSLIFKMRKDLMKQ